jgi:hypothetical protein
LSIWSIPRPLGRIKTNFKQAQNTCSLEIPYRLRRGASLLIIDNSNYCKLNFIAFNSLKISLTMGSFCVIFTVKALVQKASKHRFIHDKDPVNLMKAITVAMSDSVVYEGGKTGFGGITSYGGSKWEYAVRLSSKASTLVEDGDIIGYWDCGLSDWCHQDCRGVIYKPTTHQVIALQGGRDNGIRTGHPPYLGLVMTKKLKMVWDRIMDDSKYPKLPQGGYNLEYSLQDIEKYLDVVGFTLPSNIRLHRWEDSNGWAGFQFQKKVVQMTKTDILSTIILEKDYQNRDVSQIPFEYSGLW